VAGALATLVLAPDPAAVRQARAFVQARCQAAGVDPDACDTAVVPVVPAVSRPAGCGSSTAAGRTGKRSERLAALTEELRRHAPAPVSGPCLARLLGVNERTVERDIAALRKSGLPLRSAVGRYGGHALLAPFGGPALPPPTSVIM